MPSVRIAISAVVTPHARILVIGGNAELEFFHITNAARPCVIPLHSQPVGAAVLH